MIFIIEDNPEIADLINLSIQKDGHKTKIFHDPMLALNEINQHPPELILLDLMLPHMDGLAVCRHLRSRIDVKKIPIIMITAKGHEEDVVQGLEAGADDYITKPFSPKVLLARVKAVLRRKELEQNEQATKTSNILNITPFEINLSKREVYLNENGGRKKIDLTYTEFELLVLLIQKKGWVFTRSQIVNSIKGDLHAVTDRSVDVQVVGLRKKLGDVEYIETIRGVGYRFKE